MNSLNVKDSIEYSKGGILSKKMFDGSHIDITLFCMAKNTEISDHTSTKKGLVHVIEGSGEFNLDNEKIVMKPGIIIKLEKNVVHSLKAFENMSFLLLLF